jgi:hypothetical protein
MQLVATNAIFGGRNLYNGPIDLTRLCAPRAELNDGIPQERLFIGGKSTNIDVVDLPVDDDVPALA